MRRLVKIGDTEIICIRICCCSKTGVFKHFSWRPKYQHQNLERPKQKNVELNKAGKRGELVEHHRVDQSWGYLGYFDPQRAKLKASATQV